MNSVSVIVFLLSALSGSVHGTFLPGSFQPATPVTGTYQPVTVSAPTQQSGTYTQQSGTYNP
ncbi:hypothetical protein PGTUg99_000010, partial [Puccinia graminis f. sp. tritici]